MTKDEVISRLKELSVKLGTPRLKLVDIKAAGLQYQVQLNFPNTATALREAGLEPTSLAEKMITTDEELLNYLLRLGKKLGKRPTVMEVKRDKKYSDKIFEIRFGSIQKAYEKATNTKTHLLKDGDVQIVSDTIQFQPQFRGKAGEAFIISELMYLNFNANLLLVDLGVDVVAIKENKTFYFQVKDISYDDVKSRTIPITTSSFIRNQSSNMFYMFILRRDKLKNVLILPYQMMHALIKEGLISFNKESKDFSMCISIDGNVVKVHLPTDKTKFRDVSMYLDDWDVII